MKYLYGIGAAREVITATTAGDHKGDVDGVDIVYLKTCADPVFRGHGRLILLINMFLNVFLSFINDEHAQSKIMWWSFGISPIYYGKFIPGKCTYMAEKFDKFSQNIKR